MSLSALSLTDLASRLNERERSLTPIRDAINEKAAWAVRRAIEQGAELKEVQGRLKADGLWLLWLDSNCPQISRATAYNYIDAHTKFLKFGNAAFESKSLTQLYIGAGLLPDSKGNDNKPTKPGYDGPPPVEWLGKGLQWFQKRGGVEGLEPNDRRTIKEAVKPWVEIYPLL